MVTKLFWAFWCFAFGLGLFAILYFRFWKQLSYPKRCTGFVQGKVVGYGPVANVKIHLPKVEYEVDGKTYTIYGPRFSGVVTDVQLFAGGQKEMVTNLTTRENLPSVLKIQVNKNSILGIFESPLKDLYPIESNVPIYYNPNNPSQAYVQRYINQAPKFQQFILLPVATILVILGFVILVG